MPWEVETLVSKRAEFVMMAQQPGVVFSRWCEQNHISRKTGYKWMARYAAEGLEGLQDESRRPHHSPTQTAPEVERRVLELRATCHEGGRKIRHYLQQEGIEPAPAPSTITDILRRHGRLDPAESLGHRAYIRFERATPNELWQMDFKGHFPTMTNRCHPFVVEDDHSRFNLSLAACPDERESTVRTHLIRAFEQYGLPACMLMDNGGCWGSEPNGAYTRFEVWLMRLGVQVSHGRVRHPQTQGKLERFNRTLKEELIIHHHFHDLVQCQDAFDEWRQFYNCRRPHESLGMVPPVKRYRPSLFRYPAKLPDIVYPPSDDVRIVDDKGTISYKGRRFRLGKAFIKQPVGIRPLPRDGTFDVYFCLQPIAEISFHPDACEADGEA